MGTFVIQADIAAYSNDGETIWVTMLVLAVIAAGAGVWSFVKKKPSRLDEKQGDFPYLTPSAEAGQHKWKWLVQQKTIEKFKKHFEVTSPTKSSADSADLQTAPVKASIISQKSSSADRTQANLKGGLELLDLDFLLSVVSQTNQNGSTDVTMHKLGFKELIRRKKVSKIKSKVLKEYALNTGSLYSKDIQCEAIKELALRTEQSSDKNY